MEKITMAKARARLRAYSLKNEGKGYGWSVIVEDGRMVFGPTIVDLYYNIFG